MKREPNCLCKIAFENGRDYITPEDVTEAFKVKPIETVQKDLLEILGNVAGVGAEDSGLCAFVAWKAENGFSIRDE